MLFRDQSGVVKFFGSFAFNRKRNVLELEIRQDYTSSGTQKYVVSFKINDVTFVNCLCLFSGKAST